jgi:tight adherence protein B
LFELDPVILFYGLAAASAALVAEAGYLLLSSASSYRNRINRRLALLDTTNSSRESVLVQLRRERGITGSGDLRLPVEAFNRLVMQSGLTLGIGKIAIFAVIASVILLSSLVMLGVKIAWAAGIALGSVVVLPYLALRMLRNRRQKKFGAQFPDAIDIIVRSLRAGHPVPVAISMVAREFTDPCGTEFGIVSDEITYGADLESAMRSLYMRVGQDDLPLFVTAVAIQSSTGGNLGEILENLSAVIRQRFKMRRKIKSLAAEARMSSMILSGLPLLLFVAIQALSPDFYGSVWQFDLTYYGLGAAGAWMMIGNLMMYRMVNFRI